MHHSEVENISSKGHGHGRGHLDGHLHHHGGLEHLLLEEAGEVLAVVVEGDESRVVATGPAGHHLVAAADLVLEDGGEAALLTAALALPAAVSHHELEKFPLERSQTQLGGWAGAGLAVLGPGTLGTGEVVAGTAEHWTSPGKVTAVHTPQAGGEDLGHTCRITPVGIDGF